VPGVSGVGSVAVIVFPLMLKVGVIAVQFTKSVDASTM
jgi:hypothetical protein